MKRAADRVRALLPLLGPLGAGGQVLLLRLVGRFGWKMVLIGAAVAVYAAFRYRTWIAWMLVAWAVAAWMHAPDKATPAVTAEGEELPAELPVDPLPGILWDLIGDAPGVHLNSIVAHLHETRMDTTCDRAAVRAALGRRGIPIKASVREADGRVNHGVHGADLKAWEEARSPAPIEAELKPRSNPVATAVTCDVAEPATGVATPPAPAE